MVRTMFLSAALCGIADYFQVAWLMWYLTRSDYIYSGYDCGKD